MAKPKKKPARKLTRVEGIRAALTRDDERVASGRGKILPKWKRNALEAELAEINNEPAKISGGMAPSIKELCKAIGIHRCTFYRIRGKRGAPKDPADGTFNVDEWARYAKKAAPGSAAKVPVNGKIEVIDSETDLPGIIQPEDEAESLKLAKMREELDDARYDRAVKRGEFIRKAVVDEAIAKAIDKVVSELERYFVETAPHEYAMHSGDETICRELNRQQLKAVRKRLGDVSQWKPPQ